MMFRVGPPTDDATAEEVNAWRLVDEPRPLDLQLVGGLVALLITLCICLVLSLSVGPWHASDVSWPVAIVFMFLVVPIHELLHAAGFEGRLASKRLVLGFYPKKQKPASLPALLLLALSFSSAAPVRAAVLLHYSYDLPETLNDNQVTDVSGNGRDGAIELFGASTIALSSNVPPLIAGRSDRSIEFTEDAEGYGPRIGRTIQHLEYNLNTNSWSYATWFNRSSTTAHDMLLHVGTGDGFGANDELYVYLPIGQTQVTLEHFAGQGDANRDIQLTRTNIQTGEWHYAAVTRDGAAGEATFYVDGRRVGTDTNFSLNMSQAVPVFFGGQNATSGEGFLNRNLDGLMDDTAIWDEVLYGFALQGMYGGFFTPTHFPRSRSAGLFLYYSFEPPDEDGVTSVTDSSGNDRHGTLVIAGTGTATYASAVPDVTPGGQALALGVFDSTNTARLRRVVTTNELSFSSNDWSFAAWYRTADAGINLLLHIGGGDGFGGENELYLNVSGGSITLAHYRGENDVDMALNRSGLAVDAWHHACVTYAVSTNTFIFYIDGERVGWDSQTDLAMAQAAFYPVVIGGVQNNNGARNFNGTIDDVGVWSRVLSEEEVAALYEGDQLLFELDVASVPAWGTLAVLAAGLLFLCLACLPRLRPAPCVVPGSAQDDCLSSATLLDQ